VQSYNSRPLLWTYETYFEKLRSSFSGGRCKSFPLGLFHFSFDFCFQVAVVVQVLVRLLQANAYVFTDHLCADNMLSCAIRNAVYSNHPPDISGVVGLKSWGQEVAIFRQTAANFRQKKSRVIKISILHFNSAKLENFQSTILYFRRKFSD